jgi:hypothetical protein
MTGRDRAVADLPKVVSPLASIGERDGVELVLVSVEAWPEEVVVRLRGRPSLLTRRMEDDFGEALERWQREGRQGRPPDQPAERIFDFDVRVNDELGTVYTLRSSARGGSGTMFQADWTFVPGPPDSARRLTVTVGGGAETQIDLASA